MIAAVAFSACVKAPELPRPTFMPRLDGVYASDSNRYLRFFRRGLVRYGHCAGDANAAMKVLSTKGNWPIGKYSRYRDGLLLIVPGKDVWPEVRAQGTHVDGSFRLDVIEEERKYSAVFRFVPVPTQD